MTTIKEVREALNYWMPDETLVKPEEQAEWHKSIELLESLEGMVLVDRPLLSAVLAYPKLREKIGSELYDAMLNAAEDK